VPSIVRGATATVTLTGTAGPTTSGAAWEVRLSGSVVASSLSPNGWAVTRPDAATVQVTPPADAPVSAAGAEDYEVRHSGLSQQTLDNDGNTGSL
jgi:hypothetical protein